MMNLHQRKLFKVREFTLHAGHLNVKSRDLTSSEELNISYEEIDISNIIKQKQTDNILLIITLVFGTFLIINILNPANYEGKGLFGVAIFLLIITFVSGLLTYTKSKNVFLIPTMKNGFLEIFKSKPNHVKVEEFVNELGKRINQYLRSKYGVIDTDMPPEPQLANIQWLKEREVITPEEFENLKSKLIKGTKQNNPVGFK
ncbi:MAG: hypothetical protein WBG48_00565 [Pricia sp.]